MEARLRPERISSEPASFLVVRRRAGRAARLPSSAIFSAAFRGFCAPLGLALYGTLAATSGCGGSSGPPASQADIVLADANNYRTTAALTIPSVDTAAATDLDLCWNGTDKDLQCHGLSPVMDVDNVALLRIAHLSQADVAAKLASGQLAQSDVDGYLDFHTDHTSTCTKLSQLSFLGTPIDVAMKYVESDAYTYLLLLAKGTTPGVGARAMVFLHPTSASTNARVNAVSGCGLLDFSADLASVTKVKVSATGPWAVDWHGLTRDGAGNPVPFQKIDGVTLGYYDGMSVADLQARIFDIQVVATNLWDIQLTGGKTADLAQAKERTTGAAFTGFARAGSSGTWLLALTCSTCQTPAPVLISVIDPATGAM
jgi:hypothetical protein